MTKGDLSVVPKSSLIWKDQFSEAHEGMETSEEKCNEEKVVMGRL